MTVLHNKEKPEGRLSDDFKIPLCGKKLLLWREHSGVLNMNEVVLSSNILPAVWSPKRYFSKRNV